MDSPPANSAPTRFRRYLTVAFRWLGIVVAVFILSSVAGIYVMDHALHKIYLGTAQIQIRPPYTTESPQLSSDSGSSPPFKGEFETMESPTFLLPIITDLNLDRIWAARLPEAKESQLTRAEATVYLQKRMKLEVVRGTDFVDITVAGDGPQEASEIANAIADRYKAMRDAEEAERASRRQDSLREQIAEQKQVVDDKMAEVERDRKKVTGGISAGSETNGLLDTFRNAQSDVIHQQNLLDALNFHLTQFEYDARLEKSRILIISRAHPPAEPSRPNRTLCLVLIFLISSFLSLALASFVEMIFLFLRASERTEN